MPHILYPVLPTIVPLIYTHLESSLIVFILDHPFHTPRSLFSHYNLLYESLFIMIKRNLIGIVIDTLYLLHDPFLSLKSSVSY